jgi:hypothetical protein
MAPAWFQANNRRHSEEKSYKKDRGPISDTAIGCRRDLGRIDGVGLRWFAAVNPEHDA